MKKFLFGFCVLSLAAGYVVNSNAGDVINGCAQKNTGNLRIVDDPSQCRNSERPVSWQSGNGDLVPAPSASPTSPPKVYDDDDQFLGYLLTHDHFRGLTVQVFIPFLKSSILIDKTSGDVVRNNVEQSLFFETNDCSGEAYTWPIYFIDEIVQRNNDALPIEKYYLIQSGANDVLTFSSFSATTGSCQPNLQGAWQTVHRVIEFTSADIPFTLPVAMPLRYE